MRHAIRTFAPIALLVLAACSREHATPAATSDDDAAAAAAPATDAAADATLPFTPYAAAPDDADAAPAPQPAAGAPVADGVTTHQFWFSSLAPGADDPRIVGWIDDPCGMTPVAVVETMPLDDPSLLPDFVVEFDAAGKELQRWGKPYSAEILTIAGDELLFRANHDGAGDKDFRTDTTGRLVVLTQSVESTLSASAAPVACPELPVFQGSDFVQCYEVADADGRKRLLAWEGACS
jgi:hypothetical protein